MHRIRLMAGITSEEGFGVCLHKTAKCDSDKPLRTHRKHRPSCLVTHAGIIQLEIESNLTLF